MELSSFLRIYEFLFISKLELDFVNLCNNKYGKERFCIFIIISKMKFFTVSLFFIYLRNLGVFFFFLNYIKEIKNLKSMFLYTENKNRTTCT